MRWRASTAIIPFLFLLGCGGSEPQAEAEHVTGEDHDAVMARDAEVALQRQLAEAEGKPPVIELDEVIRRAAVDSAKREALARPVAALNAALVQLADLHRARDSVSSVDSHRAIDAHAYAVHLEADRFESEIDALLSPEQHVRFHAYMNERSAAVGLPLDGSHGAGATGTMGNLGTVGHPPGEEHAPTNGEPNRAPKGAAPAGRR